MADIPADLASGIAIGGAIVGGCMKSLIDKIFGAKAEKKAPDVVPMPFEASGTDVKFMLGELVKLSRDGVEVQRQSRDLLTETKGDHRVLELKLNQLIEECRS